MIMLGNRVRSKSDGYRSKPGLFSFTPIIHQADIHLITISQCLQRYSSYTLITDGLVVLGLGQGLQCRVSPNSRQRHYSTFDNYLFAYDQ